MPDNRYVYMAYLSNKTPIEITDCKTSFEAQQRAAAVWGVKPKDRHKITVVVVEVDDKPVIHNPAEFG